MFNKRIRRGFDSNDFTSDKAGDIDSLPRKRNIAMSDIDKGRSMRIDNLLNKYQECNNSIKDLRKKDTSTLSHIELNRHKKSIDTITRKKFILKNELSSLGYKADKRGRPKKNDSEKYKSTHSRISCYFTNDNTERLKKMKEEDLIENISSFLNELLDDYFNSAIVGAKDEI